MRSVNVGERFLIAAVVLFAVGTVVHALAWLWLGGPLTGAVSWRKPLLFCVASGLTCASLVWVMRLLPRSTFHSVLAATFSVAIVGEVALICWQQWRGVASHFNRSTDFDAGVLLGIKLLAFVFSAVLVVITWQTLRHAVGRREMVLAAKAGMLLLILSCALGFVIEVQGEKQLAQGDVPTVYQEAGVLKFAHGMPMHAIQILPLCGWVLYQIGAGQRQRYASMWGMIAGFAGLIMFALAQTFRGRSRLDVDWMSGILLALAVVCFAAPLLWATVSPGRDKAAHGQGPFKAMDEGHRT